MRPRPPAPGLDRAALLEGPVWQPLLGLAVPIVAANVLQTVYQLTDTFWLGRVGAEAVAAVSLAFPILFLLISLGGGLAVAGAVLVAQYHGSGDPRRVNHVAGQTLLAVGIVSALLSVAGYALTPPVVALFGPESVVAEPAVEYLRISFLGLAFLFLYFVFQSLLRGVGDVKTPFFVVLATVLLNFLLDPLFILGWGLLPAMGTAGAALATVGTQGLAAVVGLVLLFGGGYGIQLRPADLRPDIPLLGRIIRLGFPASVEQSMRAGGIMVMTVLVTGFGTGVLAAYGIGVRILSFIIIPALGLSMATSTLVGQSVGAGRVDRADEAARAASLIGFVALAAVGVLFFLLAYPITHAFIPDAPRVAVEGAVFVRIMALTFGFLGVQQVLAGAFRGAGDTQAAMLLAIVGLWVLRFPVAFLLSTRTALGEAGLWWSFPVSNVGAALIAVLWFRRGTWRERAVVAREDRLEEAVAREAILDEGIE